jgi:DNA-binding LytR/AlgR family response regulator
MKLRLVQNQELSELEVTVSYPQATAETDNLIRTLRLFEQTIVGKQGDRSHVIPLRDIFYFESVEEKVFCYTEKAVFETAYRLYELETILPKREFVRISKTSILNLRRVKSFRSGLSGRVETTLKNNEIVFISRSYVKTVKDELTRMGGFEHE